MNTKKIKIRPHVRDGISSFFVDVRIENSDRWLSVMIDGVLELTRMLPTHREEGHRYSPGVFVFMSSRLLSSVSPDGMGVLQVGKSSATGDSFAVAVKKCAPLAVNGKYVYILLDGGDNIEYGIFFGRGVNWVRHKHEEWLRGGERNGVVTVAPDNSGRNSVLVECGENRLIINMELRRPVGFAAKTGDVPKRDVTDVILSSVDNESVGKEVAVELRKLIRDAVSMCSGCIIAVVRGDDDSVRRMRDVLHDGQYLDRPIDFPGIYAKAVGDDGLVTKDGIDYIVDVRDIVRGMIGCDGMTIFTTTGKLIGFNVFVRSTDCSGYTSGGARSRAFEAIVRSGLFTCCYFKSHDGDIRFECS